jgi:hypothetical protein
MLGRWAQPDSIVPLASQGVQAWDRYAFVSNNPVRYNDPSGHDVGCAGDSLETCYPGSITDLKPLKPPYKPTATENIPATALAGSIKAPRSTQTPHPQWRQGPTTTPTPSPVPATISASEKSGLPFEINVDWSQVDYIDLAIDVGGIVLELGGGVALLLGQPEVTAGAEIAQGVLEGAGFVKSGYEVLTGDPSSLLVQSTTKQVQASALVMRLGRIIPVFGLVGNGASLYINLKPQIEWR